MPLSFALVLALSMLANTVVSTPLTATQDVTVATNPAVVPSPFPSSVLIPDEKEIPVATALPSVPYSSPPLVQSPIPSSVLIPVQKETPAAVATALPAVPYLSPPLVQSPVPSSVVIPVQKEIPAATTTTLAVVPYSTPSPVIVPTEKKKCEKLIERREWRTMPDTEKASYIDAIKCLQKLPAVKPIYKAAKSRFDEYQAYHINQADAVHVAGEFLPWHRLYLMNYEADLRDKCGYKGGTPYWDWTLDTRPEQTFANSPIFDPKTGFGGDGQMFTYTLPSPNPHPAMRIDPTFYRGCVTDGPFADRLIPLGPGKYVGDHCLTRGIQEELKPFISTGMVEYIMNQTTFEDFRINLEGRPLASGRRVHDGGHVAIGGEMSNFYSSPGDPLFYLHHAQLDRMWWLWQQMKPSRLYEITGRSSPVPPFKNVTLAYPLKMSALGRSGVIEDVMDIHSEPNCYTYI